MGGFLGQFMDWLVGLLVTGLLVNLIQFTIYWASCPLVTEHYNGNNNNDDDNDDDDHDDDDNNNNVKKKKKRF